MKRSSAVVRMDGLEPDDKESPSPASIEFTRVLIGIFGDRNTADIVHAIFSNLFAESHIYEGFVTPADVVEISRCRDTSHAHSIIDMLEEEHHVLFRVSGSTHVLIDANIARSAPMPTEIGEAILASYRVWRETNVTNE